MNSNSIRTASSELKNISESLSKKGLSSASDKLTAIAQSLDAMNSFDPSQEYGQDYGMGYSPQVQPFASENTEEGENPKIESFVKMPENPVSIKDNLTTHTLTCVLQAPKDVNQSDMMNYILGIGEALGVDVGKFSWSKSEKSDGGATK